MPVKIIDLASHRLGRDAVTGDDFFQAGFQIIGGCQICAATISAANACPSKQGFWKCLDCIGDSGWDSVEQANFDLFGKADLATAKELIFKLKAALKEFDWQTEGQIIRHAPEDVSCPTCELVEDAEQFLAGFTPASEGPDYDHDHPNGPDCEYNSFGLWRCGVTDQS